MTKLPLGLSLALLACLPAVPRRAAAQGLARAPDASDPEVAELARSIAADAESLSTADCAVACKAIASMRRATERLCALDPGRRCADARATVEEASRKVREACPACALAVERPESDAPRAATAAANEPPPATGRGHGGCAGCTTTADARGGLGASLAVACALALLARRRRSRIG